MSILKKALVIALSLFMCMLLWSPLAGCSAAEPLVLQITSPADGVGVNTNLVTVTGQVSPAGAEVIIDGQKALVNESGEFHGYSLLSEGSNVIRIEASVGNQTSEKSIVVGFSPPLAIYIDSPDFSGADYSTSPITATGRVSNPAATVTVNGFPAVVSSDGEFSAQVQLKSGNHGVVATASLGDQTDTMGFYFTMMADGMLMPNPGQIHLFNEDYEWVNRLEAGSTYTQEMVLSIGKSTREPATFSYHLTPVVNVNDKHTPVPWPEGLEVSIEPASFQVYPNAAYSSLMVVKAAPNLASGEYLFQIDSHIEDSGGTSGIIKVVILPPGGAIEKTITVNQSQTVNGITITLEQVELSGTGIKVFAFNTPPGYSLPQGPELAPPQFMALHASASYAVDGGTANWAGTSGIQFLESGMRHVWDIDLPVAQGSKELEFTISNLGDWYGPWSFKVPLE